MNLNIYCAFVHCAGHCSYLMFIYNELHIFFFFVFLSSCADFVVGAAGFWVSQNVLISMRTGYPHCLSPSCHFTTSCVLSQASVTGHSLPLFTYTYMLLLQGEDEFTSCPPANPQFPILPYFLSPLFPGHP